MSPVFITRQEIIIGVDDFGDPKCRPKPVVMVCRYHAPARAIREVRACLGDLGDEFVDDFVTLVQIARHQVIERGIPYLIPFA